jgi:pimeloyl-ACP methyl ester carboxylesterase
MTSSTNLDCSQTTSRASRLAFDRTGQGEPLVLLHGQGFDRRSFDPVVPLLAAERDVIAVDLPGHGESPDNPAGSTPNPIGYAELLGPFLDDLGLERVHLAGNSVGGWTSLELAKNGRALSVVALGPAGLWRGRNPRRASGSLRMSRALSPIGVALGRVGLRSAPGRKLMLGQMFGRPANLPYDAAMDAIRGMRDMRGFNEHIEATSNAQFKGGEAIDVPVTVAFGERERLIPESGRLRDELPAQTSFVELAGCGHVPTWDDPELVARTILEGGR